MKKIISLGIMVIFTVTPFIFGIDRQPYYVNTETYASYKELLRGVHYYNQERYEASMESFKNSLNSNPTDKFIRSWYSRALYKAGYMPLAVNEWKNLERMGYADPTILSKIDKYGSATSDYLQKNEVFSNFIYLKAFSENTSFLKNINQPIDIKVMQDGTLYVLDYSDNALKIFDVNGKIIKKITKGKRIETPQRGIRRIIQILFKIYPYEKMKKPRGFDLDSEGNIYIANTGGDTIFKFSQNGDYIATIGGTGYTNGKLLAPSAISISKDGQMYVADTGNNRVVVFSLNGEYLKEFGSIGDGNNEFFRPSEVLVGDNTLYVADTGNKRIQKFDIYGNYLETIAHETFNEPRGLSFSLDGNLFIADTSRVYYYNTMYKDFTLFQNSERYTATPTSVAEGIDSSIYITDFLSGRVDVYVRKEEYYANLDVFMDRAYLSKFPFVVASVTVRDRLSNPIIGLTAENFSVIENGSVDQKVAFYDAREINEYRFIYVIDDSAMAYNYSNSLKESILNFTSSLTNNDEVMVIHYNDTVRTAANYEERNLRIIENANNTTFTGGVSAFSQAMYEAVRLSLGSFKKTAIIHFSLGEIVDTDFSAMNYEEISAFSKNNSVSISQVYFGANKNNYFLDNITKYTYGKTLNTDLSINYTAELNTIKNIDFGKYYILYKSERSLMQKGHFRSIMFRVEYRDMYGEEEAGYIIP